MKNYRTLSTNGQKEIKEVLIERLTDIGVLESIGDLGDLHNRAFNEDYFIIGYYDCEQWIKNNTQGVFDTIGAIQEFENDHFGECNTKLDNSESVLNMYAHILGYELVYGNLDDDMIVSDAIELIENL